MQNMTQTMTLEKFFARIYAVMAMGVGLSAAVSFITLAFFPQNLRIFGTGAILAVWIIQMILVMALSGLTMKNSPMALPGFLVFSAFNGFTISFTLAFYDIGTITQAFLASALMFAGLALFGARTKKNLSGIGRASRAALLGLIIALIVSAFFFSTSGPIGLALSVVTVLIFSGLIMWNNQQITQVYMQNQGQVTEGWAVAMGLSLYLNFMNLFLSILRIFGIMGSSNNRNRF